MASTNFAAVKAAGAVAVIVRTNYGLRHDDLVAEHNRRADAAGISRMFYWYPLSRQDPAEQAALAFQLSGGVRGRRGWLDVEENAQADGAEPVFPKFSEALWGHVNTGLMTCDSLTGLLTGVYSSKVKLDSWFTAAQQARWAHRFGWWAHYNMNISMPWIPAGWANKPRKYEMWQDQIAPWPGCLAPVDQNRLWPGLTVEELLGASVPPTPPPPAANIADHARAIIGLVS